MSDSLDLVRGVRMRAAGYLNDPAVRHLLEDLTAALDGNPPPVTRVVHIAKEQPVSDPQPVDESAADTCQVVHIDGVPVILHGGAEMTPKLARFTEEIIRAGRRRHLAEHPNPGPDGIVRDEYGQPICTCEIGARCAYCRASKSQAEVDADVQAEISAAELGRNNGTAICTCTPDGKCPTCRATDGD